MTLTDLLMQWCDTAHVAESTRADYRRVIRTLLADIGQRQVDEITGRDVLTLYATLAKRIGPARIRRADQIMRAAYGQALGLGELARSPLTGVSAPKARSKRADPPSAEVVTKIINGIRPHHFRLLCEIAARTGMRRGELCALRWDDIDLGTGTVRVRHNLAEVERRLELQPPKSERGDRTVYLGAEITRRLGQVHRAQIAERLRVGVNRPGGALAVTWVLTSDPIGANPTRPSYVSHAWPRAVQAVQSQAIPFHALRHAAATRMIEDGTDPRTVAEILGDDVATVMRVYVHSTASAKRAALATLDASYATPWAKRTVRQITS